MATKKEDLPTPDEARARFGANPGLAAIDVLVTDVSTGAKVTRTMRRDGTFVDPEHEFHGSFPHLNME